MTEKGGQVVPFERPAAYWASRARRHYTPDRLPEAARLMRKALATSPDGKIALELAHIYAGMECYSAAERYLIYSIAQEGMTAGAAFAIGCCAMHREEEELAEKALELSLRLDPHGPFADQAQSMLEFHDWDQGETVPRGARADTLGRWAIAYMAQGKRKEALKWARRSWKKGRTCRTALLLGQLLPPQKGRIYLEYASRNTLGQPQPRIALARACFQLGKMQDAHRHLQMAGALSQNLCQLESYCCLAWEMGKEEEALERIGQELSRVPASVDYLRLKYLTLLRLGREDEAKRTLSAMLESDPNDPSAAWYRLHPEETKLLENRTAMVKLLSAKVESVPPRLKPGPLNRLLHLMVMMLAEEMEAPEIYQKLVPLWRRLSPAAKKECDERVSPHYPLAFALYLLLSGGFEKQALNLYRMVPGSRRALRKLRCFVRWMNEE